MRPPFAACTLQPLFQLPFWPASDVLICLHSRLGVRDCSLAIAYHCICSSEDEDLCVLLLRSFVLLVQQPASAECHPGRLKLASLVDRTSTRASFYTRQVTASFRPTPWEQRNSLKRQVATSGSKPQADQFATSAIDQHE